MMNLTFGLFTQVSDSGPQGPLVIISSKRWRNDNKNNMNHKFWLRTLQAQKIAIPFVPTIALK